MRPPLDRLKLERFLDALGLEISGPGRAYLVGGATALLYGWRPATVDINLYFDPEPGGVFEAVAKLKNDLAVNVELAAPHDFIPELPGWRDRSPHVGRHGGLDVYHYDLYAQALAKIERGHERDIVDVRALLSRGHIEGPRLRELFARIASGLIRYPAIDEDAFRARLDQLLGEGDE